MKRLVILLLLLALLILPGAAYGQSSSRAGVVVAFSDGTVRSSCVSFEDESISGLELVQRSGLPVIAQVSGNNAAICKIGADGCDYPGETCFCKTASGGRGQYWAYWLLVDDAWQYSLQGAGSVRVRNGDVQGWAWGAGDVQTGREPPLQTFDQICPLAEVTTATTNIVTPGIVVTVTPSDQPEPVASTAIESVPAASTANTQPLPDAQQPAVNIGSYVVFGLMLVGLLVTILAVQRRRTR